MIPAQVITVLKYECTVGTGMLTISYSSQINAMLYDQRVSPPAADGNGSNPLFIKFELPGLGVVACCRK
jgi:hypothetical protein